MPKLSDLILPVACCLGTTSSLAAQDSLIYPVSINGQNCIHVTPYPVSPAFRSAPWPAAMEDAFTLRKTWYLHKVRAQEGTNYGTTWFESEKRGIPKALNNYVRSIGLGLTEHSSARSFLQGNDAGPDTNYTSKVDLYASFTLKGQVPKYFYFGKWAPGASDQPSLYLDTSPTGYVNKMTNAMRVWLDAGDPVTAKHPAYPNGPTSSGCWEPVCTGVRVDRRNTDNLKLMREAAVYLFALEAAAAEADPQQALAYREISNLYADRWREAAIAIYQGGVSEWDSPNYTPWSVGPILNMYDYAPELESPGVPHPTGRAAKLQAKAMLDHIMTTAALKYWRGGFAGPGARDYGGVNRIYGNVSARFFGIYFGLGPVDDPQPSFENTIHPILSAYRPPLAVMDLAQRNFPPGVEMLLTHPRYANWTIANRDRPLYWETLFFGQHFQMATMVCEAASDANVFALMLRSQTRGVDFISTDTASFTGSNQNKRSGTQIAQYRNLAVFLRQAAGGSQYLLAPDPALNGGNGQMQVHNGVHFFLLEHNWVAVRPVNMLWEQASAVASHPLSLEHRFSVAGQPASPAGYAALVIEVGEQGDQPWQHADFTSFKDAILAAHVDTSDLHNGRIALQSAAGLHLVAQYSLTNDRPILTRGSDIPFNHLHPENFAQIRSFVPPTLSIPPIARRGRPVAVDVYTTAGPVELGWNHGVLSVLTGTPDAPAESFSQSMNIAQGLPDLPDDPAAGSVHWTERPAHPADFHDTRTVNLRLFDAESACDDTFTQQTAGLWTGHWTPAHAGLRSISARARRDIGSGTENASWPQRVLVVEPDLLPDGNINHADLARLLAAMGHTGNSPADLNDDATINTADLLLFLTFYGQM